jgi:hypothetical protein
MNAQDRFPLNSRVLATLCLLLFFTLPFAHAQDSLNVSSMGHLYSDWSQAGRLDVEGDYAYVISDDALVIFDIGDLTLPMIAGQIVMPGTGRDIDVSGGYAYVAAGSAGFRIIDVNDPSSPTEVGYNEDLPNACDVLVTDDFVFVADTLMGFVIFDVSDPTSPQIINESGSYSSATAIDVLGDIVVTAGWDTQLSIYDVSNPEAPYHLSNLSWFGEAFGIKIAGDYVYIAAGEWDLCIIDISNPIVPQVVTYFDLQGYTSDVQIVDDYAFLTSYHQMMIVDINDPSSPSIVGEFDPLAFVNGIRVLGDHAFVTDETPSLHILDISDVENPSRLGYVFNPFEIETVEVEDDLAYLVDNNELFIIDVSDPFSPVELGSFSLFRQVNPMARILDMVVRNGYAYISNDDAGINVFDVSIPTAPVEVDEFYLLGGNHPLRITEHENRLYISDPTQGLFILDSSDPSNLEQIRLFGIGDLPYNSVVQGDYAFVACHSANLKIVDVRDPEAPSIVTELDLEEIGSPLDIAVYQNHAYITLDSGPSSNLVVVDISDPIFPVQVASVPVEGEAGRIEINNGFAYLACDDAGMRIFDVRTPSNPVETGFYVGTPESRDIAVSEDFVLLATDNLLNVLDASIALPVAEIASQDLPNDYTLSLVYPNPFNGTTRATLSLPVSGDLSVTLFNTLGQQVMTVADGVYSAGTHTYAIDANDLSSGIYILHAEFSNGSTMSRKLMLLR